MVTRLVRICFAAFLTTALAGSGAVWAQDEDEGEEEEEEDELGEDTDPCAGISPPCGESGGGTTASDSDDSGDEDGDREGRALASGKGEGGGEGEGEGEGDGEGDGEGEGEASAGASTEADATVAAGPPSPTLGEGKLLVNASVQTSLAKGSTADPLSIAPDVWYGVNDKLTGGLVTSTQGSTGFWSGLVGTGLCPVGDLCGDIFNNIGGEALYALKSDESMVFAANVGLHAVNISETFLDAKVGAKGLFRSGKLSFGFAPSVFVPITERSARNETLYLPLDLSFMLSEKLYAGVQTGVITPFEAIGDSYKVPVALGGFFMINEKLSATLAFSLDQVTSGAPEGAVAPGAADFRSLLFALGYSM